MGVEKSPTTDMVVQTREGMMTNLVTSLSAPATTVTHLLESVLDIPRATRAEILEGPI